MTTSPRLQKLLEIVKKNSKASTSFPSGFSKKDSFDQMIDTIHRSRDRQIKQAVKKETENTRGFGRGSSSPMVAPHGDKNRTAQETDQIIQQHKPLEQLLNKVKSHSPTLVVSGKFDPTLQLAKQYLSTATINTIAKNTKDISDKLSGVNWETFSFRPALQYDYDNLKVAFEFFVDGVTEGGEPVQYGYSLGSSTQSNTRYFRYDGKQKRKWTELSQFAAK